MKKSFIIIEVLIAIFILFLTIVMVASTYKQKNRFDEKNKIYQNIYINVKNTINWIDNQNINITSYNYRLFKKLNINNMKIDIYIKLMNKKANFITNANNPTLSGNFGKKIYYLYKVKLLIDYYHYKKQFVFDLTKMETK